MSIDISRPTARKPAQDLSDLLADRKLKRLTVEVDETEKLKLRIYALKKNKNLSEIVRQWIASLDVNE